MIRSLVETIRLWFLQCLGRKRSHSATSTPQDELPEHWEPPETLQDERDCESPSDWRYPEETAWEDWDDRPRRGHRGRYRG
ncbi:hypothetical protein [Roseovarius rhodophyticola]|uniref:Uncharacterized protein n=1 Tax=Roseovarius rhodophyticola TaxID=3080827 RepID=A0ABZ2TEU8_9RHOB|nr:hypothetical protein [Roseovarius sp. W115]MDV2928423.1 hypothetical protein [Roseovarius sp. W115]